MAINQLLPERRSLISFTISQAQEDTIKHPRRKNPMKMGVDKLTTKHAQSPTKVVIIVYYLRQLTTTVYDSNADIDTPYNPK